MPNPSEFSALAAFAELAEKNKPAPNVYIADAEPLIWLVSTLFTADFMDMFLSITSSLYGGFDINDRGEKKYQDMALFVQNNQQAASCLEEAQKAIEAGQIEKHVPAVNEWGEIIELQYPEKVKSFSFYLWADRKFSFPSYLMPAIDALVRRVTMAKLSKDQQEFSYPVITQEQFTQKSKEPLWQLGVAVLYLLGRRSRANKEADFVKSDKTAQQILKYAMDAYKIGQLELFDTSEFIDADDPKTILQATVKPTPFIEWAKGLPLNIPMLSQQSTTHKISIPCKISNCDYWAKQSNWTIDEASALLAGTEPNLFEKYLCGMTHALPLSINTKRCLEIHETLKRDNDNQFQTNIFLKNPPLTYIKWAQDRGYEPPDELQQAMQKFKHLHDQTSVAENAKTPSPRPAYCTPDMQLMLDAVEKFWKDYDLENPNPDVAPFKEKVVEWLLSEAKKRKMLDFSKTRAETMDTIMRCPAARRGGNTR